MPHKVNPKVIAGGGGGKAPVVQITKAGAGATSQAAGKAAMNKKPGAK